MVTTVLIMSKYDLTSAAVVLRLEGRMLCLKVRGCTEFDLMSLSLSTLSRM